MNIIFRFTVLVLFAQTLVEQVKVVLLLVTVTTRDSKKLKRLQNHFKLDVISFNIVESIKEIFPGILVFVFKTEATYWKSRLDDSQTLIHKELVAEPIFIKIHDCKWSRIEMHVHVAALVEWLQILLAKHLIGQAHALEIF